MVRFRLDTVLPVSAGDSSRIISARRTRLSELKLAVQVQPGRVIVGPHLIDMVMAVIKEADAAAVPASTGSHATTDPPRGPHIQVRIVL